MQEPIIRCPGCKMEIKLTESLAGPFIEEARTQLQKNFDEKESILREQEKALAKEKQSIEETINKKLSAEREQIAAIEAEKAHLSTSNELAEKDDEIAYMKEILNQRDEKLALSRKAEFDLLRKQQELADALREQELTIEKRVQNAIAIVHEQAKQDAEDEFKLKLLEKEQLLGSMQKQIEELKRKSEQGSQQLQGEVQEIDIESILKSKFNRDTIEPVAKGEPGGDIIQRVFGPAGQIIGSILWESKRTKNWSDGWLAKLRADSRAMEADIAIIVSQVVPKQIETFDCVEGVWVTTPKYLVPVAIALRQSLVEISAARQLSLGRETKMELIYEYLLGPRFRNRVEAIVEKFADLHSDLNKERNTMNRLWAKREQQIRSVIEATAGMYGDLQGIAGRTLQEIQGLEMRFIESGNNSDGQVNV